MLILALIGDIVILLNGIFRIMSGLILKLRAVLPQKRGLILV